VSKPTRVISNKVRLNTHLDLELWYSIQDRHQAVEALGVFNHHFFTQTPIDEMMLKVEDTLIDKYR